MTDLEDSEESIVRPVKTVEAPARPRTRRRTSQRIRLDRVLVAAVIALAVIVPFTIRGFRVGDLPPSAFAAGSSEQTAFNQINASTRATWCWSASNTGQPPPPNSTA